MTRHPSKQPDHLLAELDPAMPNLISRAHLYQANPLRSPYPIGCSANVKTTTLLDPSNVNLRSLQRPPPFTHRRHPP